MPTNYDELMPMQIHSKGKFIALNERALFVIDGRDGTVCYSHYFCSAPEALGVQLGHVSAISRLAYEHSDSRSSPARRFSTPQADYLMERGRWAIGVVVAAVETNALWTQLRAVVADFESRNAESHGKEESGKDLPADFNDFVMRVFLAERIWERTLLKRAPDVDGIMLSRDVRRFVLGLPDDSLTISDAAYEQSLPIEEALEYALKACWTRAAFVLSPVSLHEILVPTRRANAALHDVSGLPSVSTTTAQAVARMDGRLPALSILKETPIDELNKISYELGALLSGGFLTFASNAVKKIYEYERFLSLLVQACTDIVGSRLARRYFYAGRTKAAAISPWVEAVRIDPGGKVSCPSWGFNTLDLNEESVNAGLGLLVSEFKKSLSNEIGYELARRVVASLLSNSDINMGFMGSLLEFLDGLMRLIKWN